MISLLCPTRGRPQRFMEMWESALWTARYPQLIECIAVLDPDDSTLGSYIFQGQLPRWVHAPPGTIHSDLWNHAASIAEGDIFMLCADDLIFQTVGWDDRIEREFAKVPDRILHLWCHDGSPHTEIATHPFVSREWVEAAGMFTPPYYDQWYADTWLLVLALLVERSVYLDDVLIEHLHAQYNMQLDDDTYRRGRAKQPTSQAPWQDRLAEREAIAERLRAVMDANTPGFLPPLHETWRAWGLPS